MPTFYAQLLCTKASPGAFLYFILVLYFFDTKIVAENPHEMLVKMTLARCQQHFFITK
jgi:hypothetical protein